MPSCHVERSLEIEIEKLGQKCPELCLLCLWYFHIVSSIEKKCLESKFALIIDELVSVSLGYHYLRQLVSQDSSQVSPVVSLILPTILLLAILPRKLMKKETPLRRLNNKKTPAMIIPNYLQDFKYEQSKQTHERVLQIYN